MHIFNKQENTNSHKSTIKSSSIKYANKPLKQLTRVIVFQVIEENSSLIKENAKVSTKLSRLESVDYTYKQRELKEAQNNSDLVLELKAALQQEKSSSHGMLNKIEIMRQRCEDLEKSVILNCRY